MKPIKNVFPTFEGSEMGYSVPKVTALKCWLEENETKREVWGQDSSYVRHIRLFQLGSKDTSFFWRL